MMRYRPIRSVSAIHLAIAAALAATAAPATAQERTYAVAPLAVTGEPAPGTAGLNYVWLDLEFPYLSDAGVVAFIGSPTSADYYSGDHAVWVGSPGNVTLSIRSGDPAPGLAAATFDMFATAQLNGMGSIAIRAYTAGIHGEGIWIQDAAGLRPLATTEDVAPGSGGRMYSFFWPGSFDDLGVSAFYAETVPADGSYAYETGVWTGTPGALEPVVMTGDLAPGTGGAAFSYVFGPMSSNADSMTFLGMIGDPSFTDISGIWTAGPAGHSLVALQGTAAPGAGGRNFVSFSGGASAGPGTGPDDLYPYEVFGPIINAAGDIAVGGYVDPIDPLSMYADSGIWLQDAGGLRLIALAGDPAPGTAALPFTAFNHLDFNAQGQMAFDAGLDTIDTNRARGIWFGPPDSLALLVREGDTAPGAAGETFGNLIMGADLNDAGEIVFFARLAESGADGIWAGTPGDLALIAREGELMEVKSGDYRRIQSIVPFNGGLDVFDVARRFNNAGQLVFAAIFTDGSQGLILASPVLTSPNQPPVAIAGPDQTIAENNVTVLDGSMSSDPEGTILSFSWSLNGAEISTDPKVTVGPLPVGVHTVTLTVTDRSGASVSDDVILTVFANGPPIANAGPDQTVNYTQSIMLDGTGSSDPEGEALSYYWDFGCWGTASHTGEGINTCLNATGPNPTIGPLDPGIYEGLLTVTDIYGASASDEIILTVTNDPPVANAGADQTVLTMETVALDGSASFDPEAGALSYRWSLGGVQIGTGPTPVIGPLEAGIHAITLTVTDERIDSATDEVVVTVLNRSPVADAGPDRTANHVQTVTLAGSGSDPEGGALNYAWTLNGAQIATTASATVGPFEVGVHTLTLTVTDDKGATATDSMVVTVTNGAPLASAGPDQTVNHAQTVVLDATGSSDPEGGILTYVWTLSGVQIATGPGPVVGPFAVGIYTIALTVTDDHGATATDSMTLTVINEAPVANAGPDQTVGVKGKSTTVTLDGTASGDPEGGPLTYLWTKDGQTVGTAAVLQTNVSAGTHSFTLTVTDDHGATASDTVVVTAVKGNV